MQFYRNIFDKRFVSTYVTYFGTMIGMQNHRNSIKLGNGAYMHGKSNRANCGSACILNSFPTDECTTTVGYLNDHWAVILSRCLKYCIASRGTGRRRMK